MTTAMVETFDAPMADSGDIDMSMYSAAMATTDSWLSAEASMGDVAFSTEAATFDYVQDGIEVEMLDDDEAITEYEMADEGEAYYDHELQDVEVHDASRAPSPPTADVPDLAVGPSIGDSEHLHLSPDADAPVPLHSHASLEPPVDSSIAFTGPESATQLENHTSELNTPGEHSITHEDVVSQPVTVTEAPEPDVNAPVDEGDASIQKTSPAVFDHSRETNFGNDWPDTTTQSILEPPPDNNHVSMERGSEGDGLQLNDPHVEECVAAELVAETNDPHEISEGVYIDPPPPVLLFLPPSAERAQYCLFNLPVSSTPLSPSGSKSDDTAEPPGLLLQDRPTLYYEPLSAVFEALRGENCVQNIPGCSEAELVLDAYELQLTISEDNVYAHEVTLHELNVLHDGSDLHGPLRLRLKVLTPRFVTRYHVLREQIARLNLTADGEEPHQLDDDPDTSYGHDDDTAHPQVPDQEGISQEGVTHEAFSENVEEHSGTDAPGYADTLQESLIAAPDLVDGPSSTITPGPEPTANDTTPISNELDQGITFAAALAQAEEADAEGEESAPTQTAENEDGTILDADEVHEHPDAVDGGDYANEHLSDDEDEFGDDLSKELRGQVQDAEYVHLGTRDDLSNNRTDAGDGTVYVHENEDTSGVIQDTSSEHPAEESVPEDVGDEDSPDGNDGLNTNEYTDTFHNFASTDGPEDRLEDGDDNLDFSHEQLQDAEPDDQAQEAQEESTTLSSEDEDGLIDDWGDEDSPIVKPVPPAEQSDSLSHKSSTATLASKTSKRTYDEVELDDFDDDPSLIEAVSSPDTKRARVQ
ncbi:hypothetical protein C8Q79DRAFT_956855 [Trametes meyenii]|nr:hypothetical protein C8Q79DRAFT_956855 [Trametes meyenii]